MRKPNLIKGLNIPDINVQKYERYLPTAFDESLTLLEKINRVIHQMNVVGELTREMLVKWNEVYDWVMNEGLKNAVEDKVKELLEKGELDESILQAIGLFRAEFERINNELKGQIEGLDISVNKKINEMNVMLNKRVKHIEGSVTVYVGMGSEFETINDALTYLTKSRKVYSSTTKVNLYLENDFIMREQVLVDAQDLSWITLTNGGRAVTVNNASLKTSFGSEGKTPLFGGKNGARLPVIDVLFQVDETGSSVDCDGVFLQSNSYVYVKSNKGVRGARGFGIRAFDGCEVNARASIFSHASERGCMISQGTRMTAPNIDLSYADGRNAFRAFRGVIANIQGANLTYAGEVGARISAGCSVDMESANVSYAGRVNKEGTGEGLRVFGSSSVNANRLIANNCKGTTIVCSSNSTLNINSAELNNSGGRGIDTYGGARVYANPIECLNAVRESVRASSGARLDISTSTKLSSSAERVVLAEWGGEIIASNVDVSNNPGGFVATRSGKIIGENMVANNCDVGFLALWEGIIEARSGIAKNCRVNVAVSTGSEFKGTQGVFTGAREIGVHVYRNSEADLYGAQCRKGLVDSDRDIVCTAGSVVKANDTTGGFNKEVNYINTDGIIFN